MSLALIVDVLAACLLAFFLVRGALRGFLGEVLSLVGSVVSAVAAWTLSATSLMPGMRRGSSQSRSIEGDRKSRASSTSRMPRETRVRATMGTTPQASTMARSELGSPPRSSQRLLSRSPATS